MSINNETMTVSVPARDFTDPNDHAMGYLSVKIEETGDVGADCVTLMDAITKARADARAELKAARCQAERTR